MGWCRLVALLAVACGALAGLRADDNPDQAKQLTGMWVHEDGATYAIRQDGAEVWWLGKSADGGKSWTNVFHGKIKDNQLTGQWADIPPAGNRASGVITLELLKEGDEVVKISGKGVNGSVQRAKTK
jgi:hypothetical protein